jgi:hypothetical protein
MATSYALSVRPEMVSVSLLISSAKSDRSRLRLLSEENLQLARRASVSRENVIFHPPQIYIFRLQRKESATVACFPDTLMVKDASVAVRSCP